MKGPEGTHAWTVTVGAKGQIVIPKEARTLFSIQPGDTLLLLADEKRGLAIQMCIRDSILKAALLRQSLTKCRL